MSDPVPAALDRTAVPGHVGVIMDGNGRWADEKGLPRTAGHAAGEHALFDVVHGALEIGIQWLTVYAFSTENWSRREDEVEFLMEFNDALLRRRRDEIHDLGVRVDFVGVAGDDRVPERVQRRMAETEALTIDNTRMRMVFAFNYGSRREIADAARAVAAQVAAGELAVEDVDEAALAAGLYLPEMPDADLIIRTSGEQRLSNFLLWQGAYSELVFTEVRWPEFYRGRLYECVVEYQQRTRRFGTA